MIHYFPIGSSVPLRQQARIDSENLFDASSHYLLKSDFGVGYVETYLWSLSLWPFDNLNASFGVEDPSTNSSAFEFGAPSLIRCIKVVGSPLIFFIRKNSS